MYKIDLLNSELKKIEEKNTDYFKSRESSFSSAPHQSLFEHFIIRGGDDNPPELLFKPKSGLDRHIKDQCLSAYKAVYGTMPPNKINMIEE